MTRHLVFLPALALLVSSVLHAAPLKTVENDSTPISTLFLQTGAGTGYSLFRDRGTAPITFSGVAFQPRYGMYIQRPLWGYGIFLRSEPSLLGFDGADGLLFDAFQINFELNLKAMRRINTATRGHLSVGAAITSYLNVTANSNYDNAAAGISCFFGPDVVVRYETTIPRLFKRRRNKQPHHAHAEASLSPIAAVLRPGYAYIDNYTAKQPVESALFDNFNWVAKPFAAFGTNIGIDVPLGNNGNTLSYNYIWNYHDSGRRDTWRFNNASHIFEINLTIKLRSRELCRKKG